MKHARWLILLAFACTEAPLPKPRGYFRIGLPDTTYQMGPANCPYQFEVNRAAVLNVLPGCWANLDYPSLNARIQLTYKSLAENPLQQVLTDAHDLALKHTVKADGIQEQLYVNPERQLYGLFFRMEGKSASPAQFFVTDSTRHFLRGVLYFNAPTNPDSLQPAADFLAAEMQHLMETLEWKN
jgi:gliding motility-associated lipoprotein GldD